MYWINMTGHQKLDEVKIYDKNLRTVMLDAESVTEMHDKLRVDVEMAAIFPISPWREGWYSVIWQDRDGGAI